MLSETSGRAESVRSLAHKQLIEHLQLAEKVDGRLELVSTFDLIQPVPVSR